MEYTISSLSKLTGLTTRTLRYYDQIDLLKPSKIADNGYRIYTQVEVDKLQHILVYRKLGMSLEDIKHIMTDDYNNTIDTLNIHLSNLQKQQENITKLISDVNEAIGSIKGDVTMSNKKKFQFLKNQVIKENESKYGKEIREKYGEESVNKSYKYIKGMTEEKWNETEKLSEEINTKLKVAFETTTPDSPLAQEVCELHEKWLCMFWSKDMYSKDSHKGLAEGYVQDERFTEYYDKLGKGCTVFLRDAINLYCK